MSVLANIRRKYGDLTGAQRKVADFIFENEDVAAMQTSTQISRIVNVSDTSVIRLAYALGYGSFSDMKRDMKQDVLDRINLHPVETESRCSVQQELDEVIAVLQEMRNGLIDFDQIRSVARRLLEADRIVIFGYYGEHTVAYQLFLLLDSIRDNVYYFRATDDGYRQTASLTDRSVLIGVSVKPYAQGTVRLIREMKQYGSYVITFTDSPLCELALEADENVRVKVCTEPLTGTNQMAPVMALFHSLFAEVVRTDPDAALRYLNRVPSPSRLVPLQANRTVVE